MDGWEIPILNMICHVNPGKQKQHPWLKTTHHIKTKEPHNGILSLKSPDRFQTSNQSHLPKSVIVENFPTPTDVIVIKLILSFSS